jgi:hypothetical protein
MKHVSESDLALYSSGDLAGRARWSAAFHVRRCEECRDVLDAYRALRLDARDGEAALLESLNWKRLSAEMMANIHVGLAAGECVDPGAKSRRERKSPVTNWLWNPTTAIAGLTIVFAAAWWLNVPAGDKTALTRVMRGLPALDRSGEGPVVSTTPTGVEFRENGGSLGLRLNDATLIETSLSVNGSASAHYVDDETGQVTITTVYVQ